VIKQTASNAQNQRAPSFSLFAPEPHRIPSVGFRTSILEQIVRCSHDTCVSVPQISFDPACPADCCHSSGGRSAADSGSAPPTGLWQRDTLTGDWGGLRRRLDEVGVDFGLQEQSEVWGNMAGGLRRSLVYDGLTTASVKLNLQRLLEWTGATFFVDAYKIHGRGPSGNLVGNLQIVSNIEATRDTKLYQLWLEQKLLNGHLTTQYGALFSIQVLVFPGLPAADLPSGGPHYPMATKMIMQTDFLALISSARGTTRRTSRTNCMTRADFRSPIQQATESRTVIQPASPCTAS
jgi:Carbohydrate-selective porin, OprB family